MYDPIGSRIQSVLNPEKKLLFHSRATGLFINSFVDFFSRQICRVLLAGLFMIKV
jgi:hypothetical protein